MQEFSSTASSPQNRPRSRSITVFVALAAFILGAAVVAWASSHGYLSRSMAVPDGEDTGAPILAEQSEQPEDAASPSPTALATTPAQQLAAIGSVEGRLALLEDRLSRVDFQTNAASGNAARAEGLLIAFAARRMVERGEPLSYVADQLRLRFMNAQPRAVETIIQFSQKPVTIDELSARLEALSPELATTGNAESLWQRASRELSAMFVVRRDSSTLVSPSARIDRARVMVTARRIGNAISEVERLPGAQAADQWIADARRYQDVQQALDLLETTAMLEPSRLQDAEGHRVDQPSPLATPTAPPSPAATASAAPAPVTKAP